ncbi:unnamed protein product [Auanema sp. JU1783]|nr:unnamed protein product [Auanema sp. JU1783]
MSAGDSEQDIHPVENINGGACSRRVKKRYISSGSRPTIQAKHNQMYLITTLSSSQETALINKLPKECLLHIFSFLGVKDLCRSAQVCRLWNQLALDGSNWQCVDLFTFQRDVKSSVIENLARRCGGFLKQLSLKGCENVQDSSLRAFTARCKNIEHLSLYKCRRVTDATCENLGKHCHRLLHLNLENCTAITDRACKYISEGCPNLRYLNLSWCDNITDRGIHSILTGCKNMNTLILRGCEGLTERCFEEMEQHMGNILRLNMLSCFVTDDTVANIASGSPKIEYLCLSQCTQITDRSLISLANNCKFLKAVEFTGCNLLSDVGFLQLGRHCKQLQKMDLEDCTLLSDASITCISTNCPNMADLILSHCEQITDDAIHQLCTNNKEKLRILELDNCPLISDTALSYLRNAKNLKRIDLYDCPNVSRDAINLFKAHRPTVQIQAYFAPATPPVNHQHPRAELSPVVN